MRSSGQWRSQLDERILEHLHKEGTATPSMLAREFRFTASEERIRSRCWTLVERELVEPVHLDMMEITRWGVAYLKGRLDAHHLPRFSVN